MGNYSVYVEHRLKCTRTHRYIPVLNIISDVNLTGHHCAKREGLKWQVVMGIIVDPVTKKLPHPQSWFQFQNRYFEPQSQATLECYP